MGSLVAGWDADSAGVPPKDLQDRDTFEEEPVGYFEKLKMKKELSRRSQDQLHSAPMVENPPLRRISADHHDATDQFHTQPSATPYPRAASMPTKNRPRNAPIMDWAEELDSLKDLKKKGPHPPSSGVPHARDEAKPSGAWWQRLDSGALNQRPDPPDEQAHGHHGLPGGSFIPQFNVAKLVHHEGSGSDQPGGTDARARE